MPSSPTPPYSRASLITLCVECCETYQPSRVTPFAHLDHFARSLHPHLTQPSCAAQLHFLSDVFLGVDRLRELLDLTADGLYTVQAAQVARRDRTLYRVYLLLLLDRLTALGWEEAAAYIRCQPPHCMLPLLAFLFDARLQGGWMREQWQTLYDASHVDGRLLHALRQHQTQAEELMERLAGEMRSEQARKEQLAALAGEAPHSHTRAAREAGTIPQPFKLSQSKPKALPAPLALPTSHTAREIPAAVTQSLSLQQLEQRRQLRRQATREQTERALQSAAQPALATSLRPSTLSRVAAQEEERLRESTRQLTFARAVPASLHTADAAAAAHAPTVASILREEDRYRRERADEADRLLRFECELRDEAAFQQWQSARRAEDEQQRREDIARRKHVMAQAQHLAVVSVHRLVRHKQQQASSSRAELDRRLQQAHSEEEAQQRRREESVKQLAAAEEEAVAASVAGVRRQKKETAEAVAAASRAMSEERERRMEEERAERRRLMLRIQAMEAVASERSRRHTAVVELGSAGGLALLSDMSVSEMRARLSALEEEERLHVERKRERIEADKRTKASVLSALQQQHAVARQAHSRQKDAERREQKASKQAAAERVSAQLAEEGREMAVRMASHAKESVAAALRLAAQLASNKQRTDERRLQAERSRERAHSDMETAAQRREASDKQQADRQQRLEAEAEARKASDWTQTRAALKERTAQARAEADRRLAAAADEHKRLEAAVQSAHSVQHRDVVEQRQRAKQAAAISHAFAVQASELDVQRGRQTAQQRKQAEQQWRAAQRTALAQPSAGAIQPAGTGEEEKQQLSADDTLLASPQHERRLTESAAPLASAVG